VRSNGACRPRRLITARMQAQKIQRMNHRPPQISAESARYRLCPRNEPRV
jgi:hypothetical protein